MAQQISKPRGTIDMVGDDYRVYLEVVKRLQRLADSYGYAPVQIPAFEESGLFLRSVGASSDIVRKETFDLVNKGSSKDYTLRPEFTAGIVRAVIEDKLFANPDTPLRYAYWGPVYRYERPGTGRLREFRQFGVECFDSKLDFVSQSEILIMAYRGARAIVDSEGLKLVVNYLGGPEARQSYRAALVNYFQPQIGQMCEDCQARLTLNPLRILDCKVPEDQARVVGAPRIKDYLTAEDQAEFAAVLAVLTKLGIPFAVDDRLVRGLDYYTGTVFEIKDDNAPEFGAVGGGGKYAGLMAQLGGPAMEGMGFAFGIDRLLGAAKGRIQVGERNDFLVVPCAKTSACQILAAQAAEVIREHGHQAVTPSLSKGLKGCFKQAQRMASRFMVMVNEDLSFELKDLDKRVQVHADDLDALMQMIGKESE